MRASLLWLKVWQEALGQLGGVPAEHKTDSLRAAWKQQGKRWRPRVD
ncbi:hypothetical protein EAVG_04157 [Escherichia coli H420]|nr:hypothetical protein ECC1470_03399 [Escherichia coli ECC-1470]OSL54373.1 hypothetical protein EAVG_04157 [Escherichia coli H420]